MNFLKFKIVNLERLVVSLVNFYCVLAVNILKNSMSVCIYLHIFVVLRPCHFVTSQTINTYLPFYIYPTQAHVVQAFEQSLCNMTMRLHQLQSKSDEKDSELCDMKSTIDNLRRMTGLAHTEILQSNHNHAALNLHTSAAQSKGKVSIGGEATLDACNRNKFLMMLFVVTLWYRLSAYVLLK